MPTTAGTGSETTGVAIFDFVERNAKTGIAHRHLRPHAGHRRSRKHAHAAARRWRRRRGSTCSATRWNRTRRFPIDSRPRPERPLLRPAYQGANPISDHVGDPGLEIVAAVPAASGRRHQRRRSPRPDAAGGVDGRHRLRQRRRPPAARHVVPRRRHGPRASARPASGRSSAGAARHVGDPAHAGRRAVHRPGLPRAPPAGCGRPGCRHARRNWRRRCWRNPGRSGSSISCGC